MNYSNVNILCCTFKLYILDTEDRSIPSYLCNSFALHTDFIKRTDIIFITFSAVTYCRVFDLICGEYWHELSVKMLELASAFKAKDCEVKFIWNSDVHWWFCIYRQCVQYHQPHCSPIKYATGYTRRICGNLRKKLLFNNALRYCMLTFSRFYLGFTIHY